MSLAQQPTAVTGATGPPPRLTTTFSEHLTWTGLGPDPAVLAMATLGTAASDASATAAAAAIVLIIMLER
jgi:hypothetical protein